MRYVVTYTYRETNPNCPNVGATTTRTIESDEAGFVDRGASVQCGACGMDAYLVSREVSAPDLLHASR